MRTLKLLSAAGVLPFTRGRLLAVMRGVFERSPAHLGDCLDALAEQSFLRLGSSGQVLPESAYLRYVVAYSPSQEPEDDFPDLADVLEGIADTEGMFGLGTTYALSSRKYNEARACFDRAAHLRPNETETWLSMGNVLLMLGDNQQLLSGSLPADDAFEEALDAYDKAIGLTLHSREAWGGKALSLIRLARYQQALETCNEVIRFGSDFPEIWYYKGYALLKLDYFQEALDAFDKTISLQPDLAIAWYRKGFVFFTLARVWRKSKRFQVSWADLSTHTSEFLDKAVEACEKAISLDPSLFDAWLTMGKALSRSDQPWRALEVLDRALSLRPNDPEAWLTRARTLHDSRQRSEALKAINKAISLATDEPAATEYWRQNGLTAQLWNKKGLIMREMGTPWEDMVEAFQKATSLEPNDSTYWAAMAATATSRGRHQEAIEAITRTLSLTPDDPLAWHDKAVILSNSGRHQEALESIDKAIGLRSNISILWDMKGRILRRLTRHEEAKKAFDKAVRLRLN